MMRRRYCIELFGNEIALRTALCSLCGKVEELEQYRPHSSRSSLSNLLSLGAEISQKALKNFIVGCIKQFSIWKEI